MIAMLVLSMVQAVPPSATDRCSWSNAAGDQTAEIAAAVRKVLGKAPIRTCYMLPGGKTALMWSPYIEEAEEYRVFRTTICSQSTGAWVCEAPVDAIEPRVSGSRPFEILGGARPARAFAVWNQIGSLRFADRDGVPAPLIVGSIERVHAGYRLRGDLGDCGASVLVARSGDAARVEIQQCF